MKAHRSWSPAFFLVVAAFLCPARMPTAFAQTGGEPVAQKPGGDKSAAHNRAQARETGDARKPGSEGPELSDGENPKVGGEGKSLVNLSSPRATMRSFLLAVQEAAGEHPARIEDAVACLDTSGLPDETRVEQARALARRLYTIIDRRGVKLDDLPEETPRTEFEFLGPSLDVPGGSQAKIKLALDTESGTWRFTPSTLSFVPELEEQSKEQAEPKQTAQSNVAAARRAPRATMATFINAMNADPPDLAAAVQCLDSTGQDPRAWSVRGVELARKLKNVMDKTKLVVFTEIPPPTPDEAPYVWHTDEAGHITIGKVAEGEDAGEWRFTPETLGTVDALYLALEQKPILKELRDAGVEERLTFGLMLERRMPASLRKVYLGLQGWQWIALASLLVLGWLIALIVRTVVKRFVRTWFDRRNIDIDAKAQHRALKWSGVVAATLLWLFSVQVIPLPAGLVGFLLPLLRFLFAVSVAWFGFRVVDIVGSYIAGNKEVRLTQFDEVLIPLLRTLLRLAVAVVVIVFVMAWMGKQPTTLLGALGIGGMALAFAAKDTLGNFFGSLTVLFDRPFGIGDSVVIGDVEGTVERVGFRSTRIRTFYNSMVTIPNSRMADTNVDNYGARHYRRLRCLLSLTYSTPPEKIDAFCEGVRELIRLHPYTRKDYYHVYLNKFAASSLDVLLYVFFDVPDWATELREKHHLFVDIIRLADRLGVDFAFPTQTVWLERSRGDGSSAEDATTAMDPDRIGLDKAAAVFADAYGPNPGRRGPVVIDTSPRSKRSEAASDGQGD